MSRSAYFMCSERLKVALTCAALVCGLLVGGSQAFAAQAAPAPAPSFVDRLNTELDAALGKANKALLTVLFYDVEFRHGSRPGGTTPPTPKWAASPSLRRPSARS